MPPVELNIWFSKMPTTFNPVSFNANDEITRKEIVKWYLSIKIAGHMISVPLIVA